MDQKTLEYMAERVDKAREIQKKIADLEHFIKYSDGKTVVMVHNGSYHGPEIEKRKFPRLAEAAKAGILQEVEAEIELLKQELAEI
ncbi:hypothetical protein ABES58_04490 [Paenibacillus lautus]|uniref:hypothetical protein n=1 Tax=Paenibacillus lautus TaxID=1401 RepID=UPI003D2C5DBF